MSYESFNVKVVESCNVNGRHVDDMHLQSDSASSLKRTFVTRLLTITHLSLSLSLSLSLTHSLSRYLSVCLSLYLSSVLIQHGRLLAAVYFHYTQRLK